MSSSAPIVIARVGDVERRERPTFTKSTTAPSRNPRARGHAIDEVADRAAEHQRERDHRQPVLGAPHRAARART